MTMPFTIKEYTIIKANFLVMPERMGHRLGDLKSQEERSNYLTKEIQKSQIISCSVSIESLT